MADTCLTLISIGTQFGRCFSVALRFVNIMEAMLMGMEEMCIRDSIHGGEYETSCVLHIRPALVKTEKYTSVDKITCNTKLRGPVSTCLLYTSRCV